MQVKTSSTTKRSTRRGDLQAARNVTHPDKKMYWIFSPFLRSFHWIMVACMVILFSTGLYIGDPGFGGLVGKEPTQLVGSLFSMSFVRKLHFIAAAVLIGACLLRIYGAIRYRGDRLLPKFWKAAYWKGLVYSTKHYLFVPGEEKFFLRNSLARTAYTLVYIALFLVIITGLAMYSAIRPDTWLAVIFSPLNVIFTEYVVHLIHHVCAWFFVVFAIIHIYLAFRADYTERDGEISSMISGYKFFEEEPVDLEDIDPTAAPKAQ